MRAREAALQPGRQLPGARHSWGRRGKVSLPSGGPGSAKALSSELVLHETHCAHRGPRHLRPFPPPQSTPGGQPSPGPELPGDTSGTVPATLSPLPWCRLPPHPRRPRGQAWGSHIFESLEEKYLLNPTEPFLKH